MVQLNRLADGINAYTFKFDPKLLQELRSICSEHIVPHIDALEPHAEGDYGEDVFGERNKTFYYTNSFMSSLYWVSCYNKETYSHFKKILDGFGISEVVKSLIDYDQDIRLYCGFVMISDHSKKEAWHVDYFKGANAYTLITPIFDMHPSHGGLVYLDQEGNRGRYDYQLGEAVIFGEGFEHTTEPFEYSGHHRVLLSLTIGTDKLKYWSVLSQTVGEYQSKFLILPCGHQLGHCDCLEKLEKPELEHRALTWAKPHFHFSSAKVVRDYPWSKTFKLKASSGTAAYLKVLPGTRKQEVLITFELSKQFPGRVPEVIAYDANQGWLLLADHRGQKHDDNSIGQVLKSLKLLAEMQAKSVGANWLSCVPKTQVEATFEDVCHCLNPKDSKAASGMILQTPASEFLGLKMATLYWSALQRHADVFKTFLAQTKDAPLTIEHGDFQYDNLAQLPDGQTLIYDWGDATVGPAGMSLSNPLFLSHPGVAVQAALNLAEPGHEAKFEHLDVSTETFDSLEGQFGILRTYEIILNIYIKELVNQGYADRQTLLKILPGSILAGALRWLVSWSLESAYAKSLKSVAGGWWRRTLDDLLGFAVSYSSGDMDKLVTHTENALSPECTRFIEWLNYHGAKFDFLEIRENQGGRGLFAKRNFAKGDLLAQIPITICLYNTHQHINEIRALLGSYPHLYDYMPILVRLATMLENTNPFWKPYIDILPKSIDTLVAKYPEELLKSLRLSSAWPEVKASASEFNAEYDHLQKKNNELSQIRKGILYRARILYYTRSFRGQCFGWKKDYLFIPLIDLCNHAQDSSLELKYNKKSRCFEAFAERPIVAGEEITFYYGAHSNAHFLANYGFTISDNRYYRINLPLAQYVKTQAGEAALLRERIQYVPADALVDTEDLDSFIKLLAQLRLLCSPDLTQVCRQTWKSLVEPSSFKVERLIIKLLSDLCHFRSAQLPDVKTRLEELRADEMSLEQFNESNVLQLIADEHHLLPELKRFCQFASELFAQKQPDFNCKQLAKNVFGVMYVPTLKKGLGVRVAQGATTRNNNSRNNTSNKKNNSTKKNKKKRSKKR